MGHSGLIGKTVARWDEWDETLYFTDGTALQCGDCPQELGWADVQRKYREAQGRRETARMRRLGDMLHPKDKQLLKTRQDAKRELRRQSLSSFGRALEDHFIADTRRSLEFMNRMAFDTLFIPRQRKRKKREPAIVRQVRAEAGKFPGKQLVVPIVGRHGEGPGGRSRGA